MANRHLRFHNSKIFIMVALMLGILLPAKHLLAAEARLSFSPSAGTFILGNTFSVSILVASGEAIGDLTVRIVFPPDKLQVVSTDTGKSFIASWTQSPSFSNEEGVIMFHGQAPREFLSSNAVLSTITFRATGVGEVSVSFSKDTRILSADGSGKDLLSASFPGSTRYHISAPLPEGPQVFSPTHPEPGVWYRNNSPVLHWEYGTGSNAFEFSLDQSVLGAPGKGIGTSSAAAAFSDIADGIWYFHLRAVRENSRSGETVFPLHIDTTPPADFSPGITRTGSESPARYILEFETKDAAGGIDHYGVRITDTNASKRPTAVFTEAESPYTLPNLPPGQHEVTVRAFDRAGNVTDRSAMLDLRPLSVLRKEVRIGGLSLPRYAVGALGLLDRKSVV